METVSVSFSDVKRKDYVPYKGAKTKTALVVDHDLKNGVSLLQYLLKGLQDQTARDTGTCVLGAGIKFWAFEDNRKKQPKVYTFMSAPFQGNTGSQQALKPILEHLQANYPELNAFWDDGNMD